MNRSRWPHRTPRKAARCVLALFLMMLLPVGCSDINRAGQLFDATAQVCRIIDGIRQCSQN
ncbi:hypothetical protein JNN40_08925 [Escherichia coli]|uniref:hypothetical protein n=1 Tax=Escherichia coli TaxID=562 RepID=UPI0013658264|nr:hypothetical protein [Escherichia coli]MWE78267.1 hypothetical protein [Escherichia coli]QRC06507.1 hypothetical protein JNN40_08925 [Escherichia coli]HBL0907224.1 hypothetical protein [Escherichia coli]HCD9196823.1 hypothetical protein [Escherichia coli]HCN4968336.1 hypothetical protein [Escherichia coli]